MDVDTVDAVSTRCTGIQYHSTWRAVGESSTVRAYGTFKHYKPALTGPLWALWTLWSVPVGSSVERDSCPPGVLWTVSEAQREHATQTEHTDQTAQASVPEQ